MNLGQPTSFPNGINMEDNSSFMSSLPVPIDTDWIVYFEDFHTYTAADWTVTETGSATQALTDAAGGKLLITNAASDNDSSESQLVGESFLFDSSKEIYFKAVFQVSDATDADWVIGLAATDTTVIDGTNDGVYFKSDDGDANVDFVVTKDGTATTTAAIATHSDATELTVEFYYKNNVLHYKVTGATTAGGTSAVTNLPDDEELTITFGIQNGEAVAKTMTLDYILCVAER